MVEEKTGRNDPKKRQASWLERIVFIARTYELTLLDVIRKLYRVSLGLSRYAWRFRFVRHWRHWMESSFVYMSRIIIVIITKKRTKNKLESKGKKEEAGIFISVCSLTCVKFQFAFLYFTPPHLTVLCFIYILFLLIFLLFLCFLRSLNSFQTLFSPASPYRKKKKQTTIFICRQKGHLFRHTETFMMIKRKVVCSVFDFFFFF